MDVSTHKSESKPGPKRIRPDETKQPLGLRIYHTDRVKIEQKHGSMQSFFDKKLEEELGPVGLSNTQD